MSKPNDDRPMCCDRVYDVNAPWSMRFSPCSRRAKVERDGKHYCGVHDPERLKAKREERRVAWQEKWDAVHKQRNRQALEHAACLDLSDDDLRAMIARREGKA